MFLQESSGEILVGMSWFDQWGVISDKREGSPADQPDAATADGRSADLPEEQ